MSGPIGNNNRVDILNPMNSESNVQLPEYKSPPVPRSPTEVRKDLGQDNSVAKWIALGIAAVTFGAFGGPVGLIIGGSIGLTCWIAAAILGTKE